MPETAEEFYNKFTAKQESQNAEQFYTDFVARSEQEPDFATEVAKGVKPALEIGVALVGGFAGGPTPLGAGLAAGGAALGSAAGDLFERAVGLRKPIETPKELAEDIGGLAVLAVTQYMTDRIFTGLINAGVEKLAASRTAKKAVQAEKRALADYARKEAGIITTSADITGSKTAKQLEAIGALLPPSSKPMEVAATNKLKGYEKLVKNTLRDYSPKAELVEAVEGATQQLDTVKFERIGRFKNKVNEFATGFGSKALAQSGDDAITSGEILSKTFRDEVVNPAYDAVAAVRPEGRVKLSKVVSFAQSKLEELTKLQKWEQKAVSDKFPLLVDTLTDFSPRGAIDPKELIAQGVPEHMVDDVIKNLNIPTEAPEFTVKQITDKIKFLGNLAAKEDIAFATKSGVKFQGNVAGGIYKELRNVLTNELDDIIIASGDDAFISAWSNAKSKASEAFEVWDSSVFKLMKKDPQNWAKPGGILFKPYNEAVLKKINRAIGEDAYNNLVGAWLREISESPKGFTKVLGNLDSETFSQIFKKGSERFQARNLIKSGDATEVAISKISSLVKKYPEAFVSNIYRDISSYKFAKKLLPSSTMDELKSVWLEKSLGVGKHGFLHPTGLSDFLDDMPLKFKKEIFSKSGELARMNKVAEVGNLIKDADKIADLAAGRKQSLIFFGYTASVIRSILNLDPIGVGGQLGVPYFTSKFYLSPAGSKLLTEGIKIPAGSKQAAEWLKRVVAVSVGKKAREDVFSDARKRGK
jgi:hypothetical protein